MKPAELEVENRRRQLKQWIKDHFQGNASSFAIAHGLNQGEISGLMSKKSFGSKRARNLEEQAKMPLRYLEQYEEKADTQLPISNGSGESNVTTGPDIRGLVPVISWIQAGSWNEVVDNLAPGDAEEWLPCPRAHGSRTFALKVQGASMEPKYQSGDIIFVDPDAEALHGKNVVVRMDEKKEATFKQLVVEGDEMYLRPLNPDWPGEKIIRISSAATICGVVIGKFVPE